MTRFMLTLANDEAEALARIAYAELRDPREQVRFILQRELQRRGLLELDAEQQRRNGDAQPAREGEAG